ncbi:MAG: transporter [Chitinophagales bacterium]|nr:MAG: transporter [Chitinophagales bacterium]
MGLQWFPFIVITSILLLPGIMPASAQTDTMRLSLQEAIDYALQHNRTMQNARLDYLITKKRTIEIIAEGLPQLEGKITYKNQFELPTSLIPGTFIPGSNEEFIELKFGTRHNLNVDFTAYQSLIEGRYFIGLKANKTLLGISREQTEIAESNLKNQVSKAYYAVLVAEENARIIEKNIATVTRLLNETRELYKNGFQDELAVDRLELSLSNLVSRKKEISLQTEVSRDALKYQLGLPSETTLQLTESLEALLAAGTLPDVQSFDYTQRNEYQLLNHQKIVRGYEAASYAAGYAPALSAFVGYGFNAQRTRFDLFNPDKPWFRSGYFGLEIRWQIFDSFKKGAIYQQKKLDQQKINNQIDDFKQQAGLEVKNAFSAYQNALEEFSNQKKNLALAEKIYTKTQVMYQEGIGSSMELAQAESTLTETQANYLRSIYDLLVKRSDLMKALGYE